MKKILLAIIAMLVITACSSDNGLEAPTPVETEIPEPFVFSAECENGRAGQFPCNGYGLLARVDLETLGATRSNDIWGWTDPTDRNEYAIVGLRNGTAFVNITNPTEPVFLGNLPTATSSSAWIGVWTA